VANKITTKNNILYFIFYNFNFLKILQTFIFLNLFFNMRFSNFWYYVIIAVVILHIIVGFGYLMYKLSPKKKDKEKNE